MVTKVWEGLGNGNQGMGGSSLNMGTVTKVWVGLL